MLDEALKGLAIIGGIILLLLALGLVATSAEHALRFLVL